MKPYEKNIAKYVNDAGNAIRRHPFVEERTRRLAEWPRPPHQPGGAGKGHKIGIITSSTSYQYVKEVCGDTYRFEAGMAWPLPEEAIRDFAASVTMLTVVEGAGPVIENHCRSLGLALVGKDVFPLRGVLQNLVQKSWAFRSTRQGDRMIHPPGPPSCAPAAPTEGCSHLSKNKCTVLGTSAATPWGGSPLSAME